MTAPIDLHWVQKAGSKPGGLVRPASIEDAVRALAQNPALRPVAGGTDLLLEMARDGQGGRLDLLDLTGIHGFGGLFFDDGHAVIGAGVTHAEIIASPAARAELLPLAQACLEIGSPQLRNRATIVGNLVTASPANDTISALMALDASVHTWRHVDGDIVKRTIPLHDFYDGFRSTVLAETELVTMVTVPREHSDRRGIWVKAGLRKAQAISVVHAGIVVDFNPDHSVASARIALGSVGPTVALSEPAAHLLVGSALTPAIIAEAADAAVDSVSPIDDGRATADYRQASVRTVVARGLKALAAGQERDRWPERVPLLSTRPDEQRRERAGVMGGVTPSRRTIDAGNDVAVTVNGRQHVAPPVGAGTLLDWLRETAGTGTKEGCAEGECGACTVILDGDAVMSCLVPAAQADGAVVTSIEGLGGEAPNAMQRSFVDKFAVQCGYCIPGFVVAAQVLADELGTMPTREEIELALSGNLCRCTGYYNIVDAVQSALGDDNGTST